MRACGSPTVVKRRHGGRLGAGFGWRQRRLEVLRPRLKFDRHAAGRPLAERVARRSLHWQTAPLKRRARPTLSAGRWVFRPSPGRPVGRSCPDWGTARLPARGLGKGSPRRHCRGCRRQGPQGERRDPNRNGRFPAAGLPPPRPAGPACCRYRGDLAAVLLPDAGSGLMSASTAAAREMETVGASLQLRTCALTLWRIARTGNKPAGRTTT